MPSPVLAVCVGDCDQDDAVVLRELVIATRIALGLESIAQCEAIDPDGDGTPGIDALVGAVDNSMNGCREPTPTPTPTPSESPSPGVRPSVAPAFRDVTLSTQAALRLAVSSFDDLNLLDEAGDLVESTCPDGGSVAAVCLPDDETAVRSTTYTDCRSSTAAGHAVIRNGTLIETIADCDGQNDPQRVDIDSFRIEERRGANESLLSLMLDLRIDLTRTGREGCAGPDMEQRFDGTVAVVCTSAAEIIDCPPEGLDVVLEAQDLAAERLSLGDPSLGNPCQEFLTARGALHVTDNRSGEEFTRTFEGITLSRKDDEEGTELRIDGQMSVDCLGSIRFATTSSNPIRLDPGSRCPTSGEISLGREESSRAPAGDDLAASGSAIVAGALPTLATGLRQSLHRAVNGQVYQVIQNDDSANGADAIQLTTLVGSLGGAVAVCANTTGTNADPMAVTVVEGAAALSPDAVVRSDIIAASTLPRFNRNAEHGDGRVCIGTDCSVDSGCSGASACTTFTLGDGTRIEAASPAGRLVGVDASCGEFSSPQTYAFGAGGPTLESALCRSAPEDGIVLGLGSTLIVAYETLPFDLFNAGAAGLPIDSDGANSLCPGPGVLSPGRVLTDTAASPTLRFDADRVEVDYDGDLVVDRILFGCEALIRIDCAESPTPTPTPTPTVDPDRPCGATVLDGNTTIDVTGSTADRASTAGESSCGWGGGNNSPDRVFEYQAPAAGIYDVEVTATDFTPYLYVRRGDCRPQSEELGCDDDPDGDRSARITLQLQENQRIAVVVDGAEAAGGGFRLQARRRQPDIVVHSVSVDPAGANAGEAVEVSAVVANQGDGEAAPFVVDFFLARDASGTQVVSIASLRCARSEGLAPGQTATCAAPNDFSLPLVVAGQYFFVARADGDDEVDESNETNNVASAPFDLGAAPGAILDQQIFRAGDGTVYQLVQAVPVLGSQDGTGTHRITTLASSLASVQSCASGLGEVSGDPLDGVVGTAAGELFPLDRIRRTGILRPNNFGAPRFEKSAGGRLLLGAAGGAIQVCGRAERCAATPLLDLSEEGGGIPAACAARQAAGSYCEAEEISEVVAFGLAQNAGECSDPDQVASTSGTCFSAAPLRGFNLRAGEAVVFLHEAGRDPFEVGVGSFGLAADTANPPRCAAGQTIRGRGDGSAQGREPLLTFVAASGESSPRAAKASPDGRHMYFASGESLAVFEIDASGLPIPLQLQRDGLGGVNGLGGASAVALSPDGAHVYAGAVLDEAVTVFARDRSSGLLSLLEAERNGVGGVTGLDRPLALTVPSDGRHLYALSPDVVAVFGRDVESGVLRFAGKFELGEDFDASSMAVSPDGAHVYVTSFMFGVIVVLQRNPATGELGLVEEQVELENGVEGLAGATSIDLSPDGRHVYVASFDLAFTERGAVAVFSRDDSTGALTFVDVEHDEEEDEIEGLFNAQTLMVSADGANLYVGSLSEVAAFARDPVSGTLSFIDVENDAGGLGLSNTLLVSPGGENVYVVSSEAATVFRRGTDGLLDFASAQRQGFGNVPGLFEVQSVTSSPDGRHLYAVSSGDSAVVVLARDAASGFLSFVEQQTEGAGGVEGIFGARAVVSSPDGSHLYVVASASNSLAIFERDQTSGRLTFAGALRDAMNGVDGLDIPLEIAVSPDGLHVYVVASGDDTVAVFRRDPANGSLTFANAYREGMENIEGLNGAEGVAVSPDGTYVYVVSAIFSHSLVVFERDPATGLLRFVEAQRLIDGVEGLEGAAGVGVSPDGRHIYVASFIDSSVAVFAREGDEGRLRFVEVQRDRQGGVEGLEDARSVAVSPDGSLVYVASSFDNSLVVFERDAETGSLSFVEQQENGVGIVTGLARANSVVVSPDGAHVYVAASGSRAITTFAVNQ